MSSLFLLILAVLIVGAAVLVLRQPDEFRIARSAIINAPAEAIFPHVNDLHKWQVWSPWAKLDPEAKTEFGAVTTGVGALMRWDGKKTGQGSMENIVSQPHSLIQFRLEFFKPMKAVNTAEFSFIPEDGGIRVTWSMSGKNTPIGKIMNLLMNCDKMVGEQFAKGLQDLKAIAENSASA